jgi:hypothetical protein
VNALMRPMRSATISKPVISAWAFIVLIAIGAYAEEPHGKHHTRNAGD